MNLKNSDGSKKFHRNRKYSIEESSYRCRATTMKAQAKKRGLPWSLSIEEVIHIIKDKCFYCGVEPESSFNAYKNRRLPKWRYTKELLEQSWIKTNGIDRINSAKGYSLDNVVPCCKICNQAKNDMTSEQFEKWMDRIVCFRYRPLLTRPS